MPEKRTVFLTTPRARETAHRYVDEWPDGYVVEFRAPNRTLDQNAKFHAICDEIAKSGFQWAGKPRTAAQWKVLLVSGHAAATKEGFDMVPGLEGEFVNLRESTALMSKKRSASLITYTLAFCDLNGIQLTEPAAAEPA